MGPCTLYYESIEKLSPWGFIMAEFPGLYLLWRALSRLPTLCLCSSPSPLSLSLSPAAPRARQSALQPAWQLHNVLCFPPVLFLRAPHSPPLLPVLLLGSPGSLHCSTLLAHLFMRNSSTPSSPRCFFQCSSGFLGTDWLTVCVVMVLTIVQEAGGATGQVFLLCADWLSWSVSHLVF